MFLGMGVYFADTGSVGDAYVVLYSVGCVRVCVCVCVAIEGRALVKLFVSPRLAPSLVGGRPGRAAGSRDWAAQSARRGSWPAYGPTMAQLGPNLGPNLRPNLGPNLDCRIVGWKMRVWNGSYRRRKNFICINPGRGARYWSLYAAIEVGP